MEDFKKYYRDLLSGLSGEQLSLEIALLLHIRGADSLLENCASRGQFETMWELVVDETLARFIERTFEPMVC